jgi:hypothetical protein
VAFTREHDEQPVRLWCQDETRIGLHLPRYKRVAAFGVKPRVSEQLLYEYYWLYGAVEPATGESFFTEMPRLDSGCFGSYLRALSKAYPESLNVVIVDGASAHTATKLVVPKNVVLLQLPPYCPELNPPERLWLDLKRRIDVRVQSVRESIDALREHVAEHLRAYTKEQMQSLTGYDYLVSAALALG